MFRKSALLGAAAVITVPLALTACSTDGNDSGGKETITVYSTASEDAAVQRYNDVIAAFEAANPDIRVEVTYPGADYENLLKTQMAANDLPDVFQTHGWTQARYQPYLLDLRGAPWEGDVSPEILPLVTGDNGELLALPISQNKAGINVNIDILADYGIDVPATWDGFVAAAEEITEKSGGEITPIHIAGGDSWPIGSFYNWLAIPALISAPDNDGAALKDGSFDWSHWNFVSQQLKDLQDKGLVNPDIVTAKYVDSAQLMSEGKVAFTFYGQGVVSEVERLNPDIHLQMMPIPSVHPGDTPTWSGGEGDTLAIWKDTEHVDAAKKFVDFVAQPENVKAIIGDTPILSGLTTVTIDSGDAYTTTDDSIRVLPAFDREYFPSGMWDVMCANGQELLAGGLSVEQVTEATKAEYERLRASS